MTPPLPLEGAWARLFALAPHINEELVASASCDGRYLAADLVARRTQPARDLSAMDGFAVAGSGAWRIIGESRAGAPFAGCIAGAEAVRISTGAACPPGTTGIVLVEDAEVAGDLLTATTPAPDRWIRRRGFDFTEGDLILAAGERVGPAQLALALAGGHGTLRVSRRPRVAIIECGDELVADPAAATADSLPASNGAMLAAQVRTAGADPRIVGPVPDDRPTLARAISDATDADVIVTTGGASAGEHDHVRDALADCGAELDFWRVAIRPGKPFLVARVGPQIVLGLPGNPASSFVTAFLFLIPLLRAMQGAADPLPVTLSLPLAAPLPPGGDRREFLRARRQGDLVFPLAERDSSSLRTLAAATLLIDRPIDAPSATAGDHVQCYSIVDGGVA